MTSCAARYDLGDDAYDPHNNILAGTAYLREMYDIYGSPGFLAAYNAGPKRLDDYLSNARPLPEETRRYVAMIGPYIMDSPPVNRSPAEDYAMNVLPIDIPAGLRYGRPVQVAQSRQRGERARGIAWSGSRSAASRAASHGFPTEGSKRDGRRAASCASGLPSHPVRDGGADPVASRRAGQWRMGRSGGRLRQPEPGPRGGRRSEATRARSVGGGATDRVDRAPVPWNALPREAYRPVTRGGGGGVPETDPQPNQLHRALARRSVLTKASAPLNPFGRSRKAGDRREHCAS